MFQVIKDIKNSGVFHYYIDSIEYMDNCTIIKLNKEEVLDRIAIKELQHISDIYDVNIDIRYSQMYDCIIIVVDI